MHTDLAGPTDPVAKDGSKYVITSSNDFLGCLFTYFLKKISDSVNATKRFLANIPPYGKNKSFSCYDDVFPSGIVKRLRSDNVGGGGGEYWGG